MSAINRRRFSATLCPLLCESSRLELRATELGLRHFPAQASSNIAAAARTNSIIEGWTRCRPLRRPSRQPVRPLLSGTFCATQHDVLVPQSSAKVWRMAEACRPRIPPTSASHIVNFPCMTARQILESSDSADRQWHDLSSVRTVRVSKQG